VSRLRAAALAVLLAAGTGAAGWAVADGGLLRSGAAPAAATSAAATSTATVLRTTITSRQQVAGTLGYTGSYAVTARLAGTLTALPAPGQEVRRGQPVLRVDGTPVLLFYGTTPAWRTLAAGVTDGADIAELEANLVVLGHTHSLGLRVDEHFSAATAVAVRRWQAAAGLPQTGSVPLGQVVFLPGPLRVTATGGTLGGPVEPGARWCPARAPPRRSPSQSTRPASSSSARASGCWSRCLTCPPSQAPSPQSAGSPAPLAEPAAAAVAVPAKVRARAPPGRPGRRPSR
jgi:peptidoglycan hydrolase-like protein with peptidoglycan-binding domain